MLRRWVAALLALGVLLAALSVSAAEPPRLRVVLVLDASGSMKKNDPDLLARLAGKLLVDLADARDRVTVVWFGSSAGALHTGSGADRAALLGAVGRVGRDQECTDYAQGLEAAANELRGPPARGERRLVLFLTDGQLEPAQDKGCGKFDAASEKDRKDASARVLAAATRLAQARAKVYAVGLGDKLAAARHSRALLEQLSQKTGGKFLEARRGDQLPEFFSGIFAALVGAPVSKHEAPDSVRFRIPEDSGQAHVVVRTDDPTLKIELRRPGQSGPLATWPFGKTQEAFRGPELRMEQGATPRGYAILWLKDPPPGDYELVKTGGSGALRVWVISDVGLSLQIEGVGAVVPETEAPRVRVALRSRGGKPVPLDPSFLQKVSFTVELPGKSPLRLGAAGRDSVELSSDRLAPQSQPYLIRASADHAEGFLQVDAVERRFRVIHQVPFAIDESVSIAFDTMAEEGPIPLTAPAVVRVLAPAELPTDFTVRLELAEGPVRQDLRFEPASISFGPGKPREVPLTVTFADPRSLRSVDRQYQGAIRVVLVPEHAKLASGKKEWAIPVRATLQSWTLGRWLHEYRWQLGIGLLVLLLLIWAIGRAVARDFPPKARIHYVEVGQSFESDSLIKRFAKKGAYRSARLGFPLGKKAKKLAHFVATGAGFEVHPERGSPVTPVGETEEKRAPFRGTWDQRYRLSDRYEVWLTRS
jgi:Mg-chelatase subunit ChlD